MSTARFAGSLPILGIVMALTVPSLALAEGLTVGVASTFSLGSATLGLGCGDLDVSGTFNANTGSPTV